VTVLSPHPPSRTGIPGRDKSPPLKIRSSLESSELISDTYPERPRIIRCVAEKITTVEPAGNSLPLTKSKKQPTISPNIPFSIRMIFRHSPEVHGTLPGKFWSLRMKQGLRPSPPTTWWGPLPGQELHKRLFGSKLVETFCFFSIIDRKWQIAGLPSPITEKEPS